MSAFHKIKDEKYTMLIDLLYLYQASKRQETEMSQNLFIG